MTNPDSFFGGAPGLGWPKADGNHVYSDTRLQGVIRGGLVVADPEVQHMTEMGSGALLYWDPATRLRPKEMMIVTLLCDGRNGALDERDPNSPADTGRRRLYIRGGMVKAVREALQAVGAPGVRQGGELYVAWVGVQPSKTPGFDPARTWAARYTTPTVAIPQSSAQGGQQPAGNPFAGGQTVTGPPAVQPQQQATVPAQAGPPANPFGGSAVGAGNQPVQQQQPANPFGPPVPSQSYDPNAYRAPAQQQQQQQPAPAGPPANPFG